MVKKKEIKEVLKKEKELINSPTEIIVHDDSLSTDIQDIVSTYSSELERIESEKSLISRLPVLKQKFIYMYCSGLYQNKEIARILGIHPGTVTSWLQIEEVRNAIEAYQREENIIIDSKLKAIRMKAVNKLSELLDANNELVQMQATKEILDRTGHVTVQKQEINVNLSYEERLRQLVTQDVDFTVINDDEQNNQQGSVV